MLTTFSSRPAARYVSVAFFRSSSAVAAPSDPFTRLAWNSRRWPSCSARFANSSGFANVHSTTKISCHSWRSAFCTMSSRSSVTMDWKRRKYGRLSVRFSKYVFCVRWSRSGPPLTATKIASAKRSADKHRLTADSKSPNTSDFVTKRSISDSSDG